MQKNFVKRNRINTINKYYDVITIKHNSDAFGKILEYVKETDALHLTLQIDIGDYKNMSDVKLSVKFVQGINALFTEIENNENVKSLSSFFFCFNPDQIKLLLTPRILRKLTYSLSIENNLPFYEDIVFVSNEEVFNYILSTSALREVLSECQPAKQIFHMTCAAHSIMKFLYEKQNSGKFSILTEMEIYKEIWIECGNNADPRKIKEYLQSLDVEVSLVEDEELCKLVISTSDEAKMQYEYTKSIFDEAHHKKSGINEQTFPLDSTMLVVVDNGNHMIIADRLPNGDTVLQDASSPEKNIFHSIDSFNASRTESSLEPSMKKFSGIAFNLFHKSKHSPIDENRDQIHKILCSK